jgi:hypothetical protein
MRVTSADLARVPGENLRVSAEEFGAVWAAAESRLDEPAHADWYLSGVAEVLRWLARATVRPDCGPWFSPAAPVSGRPCRAMPENIETEWLFVQTTSQGLDARARTLDRPGWLDGVTASFLWAWCGTGAPPVDVNVPK